MLSLVLLPALSAAPWDPKPWADPLDRKVPWFEETTRLISGPSRRLCYPSGLQVFVEQATVDDMVFVGTVVEAGSADEPVGQEGLAHLIEHLWFRSIQGPDQTMVRTTTDQLGVWRNANTTRDRTAYLTAAHTDRLPELLALEGARLSQPLAGLTEADFAIEREVVRNELRRGAEFMGRVGLDHVMAQLFDPQHPYAHPTLGSHDALDGLTLAQALEFTDAGYRPESTSIHLAGDLSTRAADGLIQAWLPPEVLAGTPGGSTRTTPCQTAEQALPSPQPPYQTALSEVEDNVDNPLAILAWSVPAGYTADGAMARSVASVMGWYMSDQLDLPVSCGLLSFQDSGVLLCEAELRPSSNAPRAIRRMKDAAGEVWRVPNWSWVRIYQSTRRVLAADFLDDNDFRWVAGESIPFDRMVFSHYTGSQDYVGTLYSWLSTPAIGDAEQYSIDWLQPERAVSVIVRPRSTAVTPRPGRSPAPLPEARRPPLSLPAAVETLQEAAALPDLTTLSRFSLDSGLSVMVMPGGVGTLVRAMVVLPGGRAAEPVPGVAEVARRFLSTTFGKMHNQWFRRAPWFVGGEWTTRSESDALIIGVSGSNSSTEAMLYMLRRRLEQARIDTDGRRDWLKEARADLTWLEARPDIQADTWRMDRILGRGHPARTVQNQQQLDAERSVSKSQMKDWLDRTVRPEGATLILTGAVEVERLKPMVETWFSDWRGAPEVVRPARKPAVLPAPGPREIVLFDQPATSQHLVEVSCLLTGTRDVPTVTEQVAGAWLSDRLFYRIRVSQGRAYSPSAWVTGHRGGGVSLSAFVRIQHDSAAVAVTEVLGMLERMRDEDIDPVALSGLKHMLARERALTDRSSWELYSLLAEEARTGTALERLQAWPAALAAVTSADLAAVASTCLDHEAISITGPAQAAAEQLSAAGLTTATAP